MLVNGDTHPKTRNGYPHSPPEQLVGYTYPPERGVYGYLKPTFDVGCALVGMVLTAPLVFLACLAVKLTSRGPMFYCQTRLGRAGKLFRIIKIRTMTHNCEGKSGACWAKPNDVRITSVGYYLRKFHIDELPQFINVLKLEMSLVGPRPERPEFLPELTKAIPHYRERMQVRPGLTGLAQVQLPPDTNLDSVRRKLIYDRYYIQHLSIRLDLKLLFATAIYVFKLPYAWLRYFGIPNAEKVEVASKNAPAVAAVTELNPELNPV